MRVVKGLTSALVLAALVVGIPAALVLVAGNPIPSGAALQGVWTQPDYNGQLLFGSFLPIVAWVAWATFALSVLVEIPAAVKGINAPHIRGLGTQQAFAAALIGAIVLMITAGSLSVAHPAVAAEPQISNTTATSQQHTAPVVEQVRTSPQKATPPASEHPSYTVQTGDSLWKIAEQRLGDGTRYTEIAALNYGLPQPDGGSLSEDHWIDPGWTLALPADAHMPKPATTHTVAAGETLSEIAAVDLGNPNATDELFQANVGVTQPDGDHLSNPNLIRPGWNLTLPGKSPDAVATHTPAAPAKSEPIAPTAAPHEATAVPAPAATPDVPATVAPNPAGMGIAPTQTPSAEATSPAVQQQAASSDTVNDAPEVLDSRTIGGLGAIACAGILSILGVLRLRQRRRRQPGKRVAMPEGAAATVELQMRAVEDPLAVEDLDKALKILAVWGQDTNTALPQMFSVRIAPEEIALYLAAPAELPAPFVRAESDGTVWTVDARQLTDPQRIPSAPYPALVTLGQDSSDAHILVDLEYLGSLNVTGSADLQAQVLNAMAVEMASSPWGEGLQITLVDVAEGLPAALQSGRVQHVEDMGALLTRLRGKAKATHEAFQSLGVTSVEEARALGANAESWVPEIVILGSSPSEAERIELAELVTQIPRLGIAAITAGDLAGDWNLDVATATTAILAPLGLELNPQTLSNDEYSAILAILKTTDEDETEGPAWAKNINPAETDIDSLEESEPPATRSVQDSRHLEVVADDRKAAPETTDLQLGDRDYTEEEATLIKPSDFLVSEVEDNDSRLDEAVAEAVKAALGTGQADTAEPIVCVLGTAIVRNPRGQVPTTAKQSVSTATVGRCTALAAFLALNPGSTAETFHSAFWPNQDPTGKTASSNRNKLSNQTRNWLGQNGEGEPYLPHAAIEGYRLHPAVKTDWQIWLDLIGDDAAVTSTERLVAALKLVRGRPFEGVKESNYAWAEVIRQEMIAAICDAAHELANRSLRKGDVKNGRLAAAKGILVDPTNEAMWRDAMLAEHIAGDGRGVKKMVAKLQDFLNDFEDGYEPEEQTQELIEKLLGQAVA